jgi:hypothetical protein
MAIWYFYLKSSGIFSPFWYVCTKKNLATLLLTRGKEQETEYTETVARKREKILTIFSFFSFVFIRHKCRQLDVLVVDWKSSFYRFSLITRVARFFLLQT